MDIDEQNAMLQRVSAQAFWDEADQMSKEAIGFGAIKKVLGVFKGAPKKPVLSPVEQMAKKFMADPKALKSVGPSPTRAAASRIADAHGARPGRKYAAMAERLKVIRRVHDIVEVEPGSIHLTKTSVRSLLQAARVGSRLLRRRVTHVGRTAAGGAKKYGPGVAKAGLLGGGLAAGGAALGASNILKQHAQQQMSRQPYTPYRPV